MTQQLYQSSRVPAADGGNLYPTRAMVFRRKLGRQSAISSGDRDLEIASPSTEVFYWSASVPDKRLRPMGYKWVSFSPTNRRFGKK